MPTALSYQPATIVGLRPLPQSTHPEEFPVGPLDVEFPRSNWSEIALGLPPFDPIYGQGIRVEWAGRRASQEWIRALSSNDFSKVNEACFVLAVFDKVLQLAEVYSYADAMSRNRPATVREWQKRTDPLIEPVYNAAAKVYPRAHKLPPLSQVAPFVRAAVDRCHTEIDSKEPYPAEKRPNLDPSWYGDFDKPEDETTWVEVPIPPPAPRRSGRLGAKQPVPAFSDLRL